MQHNQGQESSSRIQPSQSSVPLLEKIMYLTPEQITSANKAGLETVLGFAGSQFAAFERLSVLNFNAAKAAFEEGLGRTKALLNAKDAQEYFALNTAASQPALEKAVAYSRGVYEVAAQSQSELVKFLEARSAEFSKNLVGILDKVSKSAPAGSDVAVAAVKSALAAASTAYDSFNKVAKQATEIAEANFAAAATPTPHKEKKHAAAAA
ncbi:MAG TPA: phasin family protein [Burkholderiales bacterium]|nr:phasin family protein [Burkholderiales bacterium]